MIRRGHLAGPESPRHPAPASTHALRMPFSIFLLGWVAACCCVSLELRAQGFATSEFTESDGLPSSRTLHMAQTPDDVLWVVTRGGLACNDGSGFVPVPAAQGFSSRFVLAAPSGGVCIVGPNLCSPVGRLRHRDDVLQSTERICDSPAPILAAVFLRTNPETLLLAAGPLGFQEFELASGALRQLEDPRLTDGSGLDVVPFDGGFALASSNGVFHLRDGELRRLPLPKSIEPAPISGLGTDPREPGPPRLWMLGTRGLAWFADGRCEVAWESHPEAPRVLETSSRATVLPDGFGGCFFGDSTQLLHLHCESRQVTSIGVNQGLSCEGVTSGWRDHEGTYWFAAHRALIRWPSLAFRTYDSRTGLLDDEVASAIELADGAIVLGQVRGVSIFRNGHFATINFMGDQPHYESRICELIADREGGFYCAARLEGVVHVRADGQVDAQGRAFAPVECLAETSNGTILAGTSSGFGMLVDTKVVPFSTGIPDERVTRLRRILEFDGRVLACTAGRGVLREGPNGWKVISSPDVPSANSTYTACQASDGRILVGTMDGVFRLTETSMVRDEQCADLREPVFALHVDRRDRLWIGTQRGFVRYSSEGRHHFTSRDGLASQEANRAAVLETRSGALWFGTDLGVSLYDPAYDRSGSVPPARALIQSLLMNGRPVSGDSMDAGSLTAKVCVPSFRSEPMRYEYRLGGGNIPWLTLDAGTSVEIVFPEVTGGNHRFEVRAARRYEGFGPIATSPTIAVRTPLLDRWPFRAGVTTVLAGALAAVWWQRRASRRALAASERRYREAFENNPVAQVLVERPHGRIVRVNPAAAALLERPSAALENDNFENLFDTSSTGDPTPLSILLREGSGHLETFAPTGNGRSLTLDVRIDHYDEERWLSQVTLRDVSEQRALESVLEASRKRESVARIASGISHDFNNILTAIMGCAENILTGPVDCDLVLNEVREIDRAAHRGAQFVRRLLGFARRSAVEGGSVGDVPRTIDNVVRFLSRVVGEDIALRQTVAPDVHQIDGQDVALEQALVNIILNARDAMPSGGTIRIAARCRRVDPSEQASLQVRAGAFVEITVTDDGLGMDEATLSRVFEPFFTTKPGSRGTGLGLPTVMAFARDTGGTAWVRSVVGAGTTVGLLLGAGAAEPRGARESAPPLGASPVAVDGVCLLVEDDAAVRRVTAEMLQRAGFQVLMFANAEEALASALRSPCTLRMILTDVVLTGMSGTQFVERVRSVLPDMPVLFMSGHGEDELRRRSPVGEPVLAKPFTTSDLLAHIERVLGWQAVPTRAEPKNPVRE